MQIRHSIGGKILVEICWWKLFGGKFVGGNFLVENFVSSSLFLKPAILEFAK